jgi:hypothetical protein
LGYKYMWKPPGYTYPLHRPRQHDTHHTFDKSGLVVTAAGCGTRTMRSTSSVLPASVRVREWFQGPVNPPEWLVRVPPTFAVRLEPGEPDKGVGSAAAASGELEPTGSHDHSQADVTAAVPAAGRGAGAYLATGGGAGASGTCASGIMARVGCRGSLAAGNASLEVQKAGRGNAGSVCFGCEREGVGPRWRRRADGGGRRGMGAWVGCDGSSGGRVCAGVRCGSASLFKSGCVCKEVTECVRRVGEDVGCDADVGEGSTGGRKEDETSVNCQQYADESYGMLPTGGKIRLVKTKLQ